ISDGLEVWIWDAASGRKTSFEPLQGIFNRDRTLLIAGSNTNTIRILELPSGPEIAQVTNVDISIRPDGDNLIEFNPKRGLLAIVDENAVSVRTVSDGRQVARLLLDASVKDIAFNQDGSYLATRNNDGIVQIWEIAT